MIELAEKRMNELRVQQANSRMRDSSSLPPMPSSDADNQGGAEAGAASNIPDLVRDVESKIYRVRPFGLDKTINLRELNPGGRCFLVTADRVAADRGIDMDKLVSIKGLVIRTTPIIPDMRDGEWYNEL